MKIRSDFVTNSSSSSFIIGKKDDASVTIESVYQTVRRFYKCFLAIRDAAIKYIAKHPEMKMQYVKKGNYETFECIEKDMHKRWELQDQFEETCEISVWECFTNYDWLDCETYLEYEKYWLDKMSETEDYRVHAPFTIADFLEEREIEWLHFRFNPEWDTRTHKVSNEASVLGWYFPYIKEGFSHEWNCDVCKHSEWCDKEECYDTKKKIEGKNIPGDKACLYLLGRVCIHSESGYIPSYVVEMLSNISEYSCNHMG